MDEADVAVICAGLLVIGVVTKLLLMPFLSWLF